MPLIVFVFHALIVFNIIVCASHVFCFLQGGRINGAACQCELRRPRSSRMVCPAVREPTVAEIFNEFTGSRQPQVPLGVRPLHLPHLERSWVSRNFPFTNTLSPIYRPRLIEQFELFSFRYLEEKDDIGQLLGFQLYFYQEPLKYIQPEVVEEEEEGEEEEEEAVGAVEDGEDNRKKRKKKKKKQKNTNNVGHETIMLWNHTCF